MRKLLKGAFYGGLAGVLTASVRAYRDDEPIDELTSRATQAGAVGAVIGGTTGLVLDRRSRRKASRAMAVTAYATATSGELRKLGKCASKKAAKQAHRAKKSQFAKSAKPRIDQAMEIASEVREVAGPIIEQARPIAKEAVKTARHKAKDVKKAAKPVAKEAREFASDTADAWRPHAKKAARKAAKGAYRSAHRAQHVAQRAAEKAAPNVDHAKEWALDLREHAHHDNRSPVVVKVD